MIMSKMQAKIYTTYLEILKKVTEEMILEINAHYDTWKDFTELKKLRTYLKNTIKSVEDVEDYYKWYRSKIC